MPEVRVQRFGAGEPGGAGGPVLVCFPHAGGGASVFRNWARWLPPGMELAAVQLPGREERAHEPFITDFAELLPATADAVREVTTGRPYVLFGHSIGSLLAFELARLARRRGEALPAALAVSALPAPHTLRPNPAAEIPDEIPEKAILDFLSSLVHVFSEGPGTQPELMRKFLPVLRADFAVANSYRYAEEPPLACPLHVFGGTADRFVRPPELEKWRGYTNSDFSLHVLRGGHFYLHQNSARMLRVLAPHLTAHALSEEV